MFPKKIFHDISTQTFRFGCSLSYVLFNIKYSVISVVFALNYLNNLYSIETSRIPISFEWLGSELICQGSFSQEP